MPPGAPGGVPAKSRLADKKHPAVSCILQEAPLGFMQIERLLLISACTALLPQFQRAIQTSDQHSIKHSLG
jgi:hypothetical protein